MLIHAIALMVSVVTERPDDEVTPERVLESASSRASFHLGLRVASPSGTMNVALDDHARGCGADLKCVSAWLEQNGIALLLSIVVNRTAEPAIVTTRLVDNKTGATIGTELGELATLEKQVSAVLAGAGYALGGKLAIEAHPADAIVTPQISGPVAEGEYLVTATKAGYVAQSTRAQVRAGQQAQLLLELQPEEESIFASGWFWGATAAAVVTGAAITIAIAAGGGDTQAVLCERREGFTCP